MPSPYDTISNVIERSKRHEGGHALVYHLMDKNVVDWNINTYPGQNRERLKSVLASPYAQPAFVSYQTSRDTYDDGDILGSLAGLAAEDDEEQFRSYLKYNTNWNDLKDVYRVTRERMRETLGRFVFPCEVRVVIGKVYKRLAYTLRQPHFRSSLEHVGNLLERESAERKVADPVTGWLEERQGESVSAIIDQMLQREFDASEVDEMEASLGKIRVDRIIRAYHRLRERK